MIRTLTLAAVLFLSSLTQGANVVLEYEFKAKPDFYINDTLNIRCKAFNPDATVRGVFVQYEYQGEGVRSGCVLLVDDDSKLTQITNLENKIGLAGPANEYCTSVGRTTGEYIVSVEGLITDKLDEGAEIYCLVSTSGGSSVRSPKTLNVTRIKKKPNAISFNVSKTGVVEGQEFKFECSSTGADPPSEYRYEVIKSNGENKNLRTNAYTPTSDDRDGFSLRCTDTKHPHWIRSDTVATEDFYPCYIFVNGPSSIEKNLNPIYENSLECDVTGSPEPLKYDWTRSIGADLLPSARTITIPARSAADGDVEMIVCTASSCDDASSPTVSYNITWSMLAPKPTTTATATQKSLPVGAIIGGAVGGVVVIGLIVLIIYCCRKRSSAKVRKRKQEKELGHMEYNTNMQRKNINSSKIKDGTPAAMSPSLLYKDEPIIYTELDHTHIPQKKPEARVNKPKPKPKDPNDSAPVEYASIDLVKTANYKLPESNAEAVEYTTVDVTKKSYKPSNGAANEAVATISSSKQKKPAAKPNAPPPPLNSTNSRQGRGAQPPASQRRAAPENRGRYENE